ncbi:MAG: YtxH domain-containing protein [Acidobacteria bacterium]|nr:YtxH domain-containing protein [Acidobacteriota bacterium]
MASSSFSCFCLGLGVGAAVGLLLAPKAGEDLVGDLRERAGEGREYLRERGGELRTQADRVVERGRGTLSARRDQLQTALDAGRRAYREAAQGEWDLNSGSV